MKFTIINIVKIIGLSILIFVLNPIIHAPFDLLFGANNSITGTPDLTLLGILILIQVTLFIIVFRKVKEYLPLNKVFPKGILFALFFLVSIQVPSVFGVIAFEKGGEWLFFTEAKIAIYITLIADIIIFLIMGAIIGKLYTSNTNPTFKKAKNFTLAIIAGAILFPIILWASMSLAKATILFGLDLPVSESIWFNSIFYGIFFITGACLPILHSLITQNTKLERTKRIALSTVLFLCLWMPVQNFMVVFGWSFIDGFIFSLISIIPIIIVIYITDLLMSK